MTNEAQKLMVLELVGALARSWWTVVAGVCLGLSVAVVAIQYTPRLYMGQASIAANVERLPREFIRPTISDDLEIQLPAVRDAVLSRGNLQTVAREAFTAAETEAEEAAIVENIARSVRMNFDRQRLVIGIYYRDMDRQRAADVVNRLAKLFVEENQMIRAESARMVSESLISLTRQTKDELDEKRKQLAEYLAKHPHSLEDERLNNEDKIDQLKEELDQNEREVEEAWQRVRMHQALQTHGDPADSTDDLIPRSTGASGEDPRISQLNLEIEELLHRVTENHPDVQAKRREIERIRKANASRPVEPLPEAGAGDNAAPKPPPPPGIDIYATQIRAAELDAQRLERQSRRIRQEMAQYQGYLNETPTVQFTVDELTRDAAILEARWEENEKDIATARSGEQLEEAEYGNPFVITGYASPPADPVQPNPLQYLTAGVVGGLGLFVLPVMAGGFLRPKIMSEMSLGLLADVPVLAVIPVIATPESRRSARRARHRNLGLSILAASVLCAVVALQHLNLL